MGTSRRGSHFPALLSITPVCFHSVFLSHHLHLHSPNQSYSDNKLEKYIFNLKNNTKNLRKTQVYYECFRHSSTMHYALCNMHYALFIMHYILCTIYYALCTMYYALFTMHYTLCTMHYALYTMHYALCTMHYALCTMHLCVFIRVYYFIRIHTYLLFHMEIR